MRLMVWLNLSLRAWAIGARTARYNENLQSRTRTTLGLEIPREKICGHPKIFGLLQFLESAWCLSRQFERLTWYKWTFDVRRLM